MIFEKLLEDFKRANKAAKEKLATKFGFKTVDEYEAHLYEKIGKVEPVGGKTTRRKPAKVVERVTVHNVHILDASGSMQGGKMKSALTGINQEMTDMRKDDSTEVTQTIVHFSDPNDIQTFCWKSPLGKVEHFSTKVRGCTALLETVGNTLTKLLTEANGKDKVLVKIFTDGQENATSLTSPWRNPKAVSDLIKQCENKGFTITFVGTEEDVAYVVNLLSIDASNTLAHDNTEKGVLSTYNMSMASTAKYRGAAARGEDVTRNFFTKEEGTL
jgi:uncharacterized protein YegL